MKRTISALFFIAFLIIANPGSAASGSAWAVIDADTGRLLDGQNENVRLPIASLTKVWTALTFIESGVSGDVPITHEAASAEGSSIYLETGSVVHSDTLLYGLMLRSGNDAAQALAYYAGGSAEGFVSMMNEKAKMYGLEQTVFTNPSGLHDEQHLSTAYETGLMLYFALQNEKFSKIASTENFIYKKGEENRSFRNKHRLLHTDPYAIAGKTGFTKAAGRTLVTCFEKDGKRVIVVTLNNGNDWNTHKSLSDKVFREYKMETVAKKGTYSLFPNIEGELSKPLRLLLTADEKENVKHIVYVPRGNEKIMTGKWTVTLGHEPLLSADIVVRQK